MGSKDSENKDDIRPKIEKYIRMHPGTSFKAIKTLFDLSDGTLRYHLRYLQKQGKIRTNGSKRIYYPTDSKDEKTFSKTQQKLIYSIKQNPGITQKGLAVKTRINRLTIRNNINHLIEREVIFTNKIGKEIHHYYIYPEELEKIKTKRMITKFLLGMIDEETYWELRST